MRLALAAAVVLWAAVCQAQYVSYWFQGWQRQGNAADAQAYFMRPGTNIVFSYASNRVYINTSGTITNIAATTNATWAMFASNSISSILASNAIWATNWTGSNDIWLSLSNQIVNATNGFVAGGQTNIYATNLIGLLEGTNVTFTTNGSGYLSINAAGGGGTNYIPPPTVPANLYAWYKLDDATNSAIALDSGTNYFNAQLVNWPTGWRWIRPGQVGPGALSWVPNNYLSCGSLTNIGFNNGTITWWMYQTNVFNDGGEHALFFQKGSQREFWMIHYSDNKLYMGWTVNSGGGFTPDQRLVINASSANWPTNVWTHYAFVWSSAGSQFYVNTILQIPTTAPATTIASNLWSSFIIGQVYPSLGGPWYFNGMMDDIRIYNTNLTAAEISSIYGYSGALDYYVAKAGDTMTGPLIIDSYLAVDSPLTNYARIELYSDPTNLFPALNVTNIWGRTVAGDAVTPMAFGVTDTAGTYLANITYNGLIVGQGLSGGYLSIGSLSGITALGVHYGDGSGLTNIASTNIVGTMPLANMPTNVAYLNSNQTFSGANTFTNAQVIIQQPNANAGLVVSNGANYVAITNGAVSASGAFSGTSFTRPGTAAPTYGPSSETITVGVGYLQHAGGSGFDFYQGASLVPIRIQLSTPNVILKTNVSVVGTLTVTNTVTSLASVTATNFVASSIKWVDVIMNYAAATLGPNAPALTAVTNGSVIQELAFDNTDILYAQGQFPHTIAITNAAFPSFYFEPHVHFTTIGTLDSTHSNVTWRVEWEVAPINGPWYQGTNTITVGVTNNYRHYLAELGHITNNHPLGVSAIFRCRLMRPASVAQDYSNAHDVLLDGFDLHVPIGNQNAIGSSTDNAP